MLDPSSFDAEQVSGVPQAPIGAEGFVHAEAYLALDPVDGTTNFACGGPDWGVSARKPLKMFHQCSGLLSHGVLGILGNPPTKSCSLTAADVLQRYIWVYFVECPPPCS